MPLYSRVREKVEIQPVGPAFSVTVGPRTETARLRLRHFTERDLDCLVALDSDPEVMHFITGGVATSRAEIEQEVLPAFLGYHSRGSRYGFWVAEERITGSFLGWFHLQIPQRVRQGGAAPAEHLLHCHLDEGRLAPTDPNVGRHRRSH